MFNGEKGSSFIIPTIREFRRFDTLQMTRFFSSPSIFTTFNRENLLIKIDESSMKVFSDSPYE